MPRSAEPVVDGRGGDTERLGITNMASTVVPPWVLVMAAFVALAGPAHACCAVYPSQEAAERAFYAQLDSLIEFPLQKVFSPSLTPGALEKLLGKPDLTEEDTYYYVLHEHTYALAVHFKKEHLKRVHYQFKRDAVLNVHPDQFSRSVESCILGGGDVVFLCAKLKRHPWQLTMRNGLRLDLNTLYYNVGE